MKKITTKIVAVVVVINYRPIKKTTDLNYIFLFPYDNCMIERNGV